MISHGFSMLRISILLSILKLTVAQAPDTNNERNCSQELSPARRGPVPYNQLLNATGSLTVPGIPLKGGDGPSDKNWTWSIGVQHVANETGLQPYLFNAPVWLDTHGTDLASEEVDFQMCYRVLPRLPLWVQRKGQGDAGDCKKVLSEKCVADWLAVMRERGSTFYSRNSTMDYPCEELNRLTPDSCKDFRTPYTGSGFIPPKSRKCPFGLGDPDYDTFLQHGIDDDANYVANKSVDLSLYDELVTGYLPLLVIAYGKNTSENKSWATPQIMCLKPTVIRGSSRKPSRVPDSSSSVRVGSLLAVSVIAAFMLSL